MSNWTVEIIRRFLLQIKTCYNIMLHWNPEKAVPRIVADNHTFMTSKKNLRHEG